MPFSIFQWLRGRKSQPIKHVVLYTRQGCHLCDEALALLHRFHCHITEIDIDADPKLVEQFGDKIPVIEIDGRPRLWGKINEVLLRRLLKSV